MNTAIEIFARGGPKARSIRRTGHHSGYALLDVVLAVAIFAVAVTGLVGFLQQISDTSASFARDRLIQYGLEAALAEAQEKPVEDMNQEVHDERMDVTYRTTAEPLTLDNGEGNELDDLYLLTVTATFQDDGGEQVERAELVVMGE